MHPRPYTLHPNPETLTQEREAFNPLEVFAAEPVPPAMTGFIKSSKERDVKWAARGSKHE